MIPFYWMPDESVAYEMEGQAILEYRKMDGTWRLVRIRTSRDLPRPEQEPE